MSSVIALHCAILDEDLIQSSGDQMVEHRAEGNLRLGTEMQHRTQYFWIHGLQRKNLLFVDVRFEEF